LEYCWVAQVKVGIILLFLGLSLGLGFSHGAYSVSEAVKVYNQLHPSSPPLTEAYVEVSGQRLHYVTAGEGPLLILYHGFPGFWYIWKNQIAALSASFKVVAVDGLGVNLSDKPQQLDAYRMRRLAQGLDELAYALGGNEPFVLVGHDWGGALAWSYAQQYPERLRKLVVLSAPPYNLFLDLLRDNEQQQKSSTYISAITHPWVEYILAANDAYLLWRSAYRQAVKKQYLTSQEGALFRQALAQPGAVTGAVNWYRANIPEVDRITANDYWPRANPGIAVPSMLIWGRQDKTFVSDFLALLPDYAEDLSVEVIAGAGHKPQLSHAQQVNQMLHLFLCDTEC
jgi:pimeloyl-ACP methyl ester carboxylesterase